jgi:hypothetical protein
MKLTVGMMLLLGLVSGIALGYLIGPTMRIGGSSTSTVYSTLTNTETVYITITYMVTTAPSTGQHGCIVFSTVKDTFKVSEPVGFVLVNNCGDSVVLSNSAPWRIESLNGEVVFRPISLQVLVEVKPGESVEWIWDQRDNEGKQVSTGLYYVVMDTFNKGSFRYGFWIR